MNIYIYGTGAVGAFVGSLLFERKCNVLFLSRGKTFSEIKSNGLELQTSKLNHPKIYPEIYDTNHCKIENNFPFEADLVIYCVKSYHNEESINYLSGLFKKNIPYILTLQNGFRATEQLYEFYGDKILTGAAYIDAILEVKGKVFETGGEPKIVLGSMFNNELDILTEIFDLMNSEELAIELNKDIKSVIWRKLMYISSLSGIMCLYRQPLENILTDKTSQHLLKELINETYNTSIKNNANIHESEIQKVFDELYYNQPNSISSMYEDMKKGNLIEVDAIQKYVSDIASTNNLPVPFTDLISTVLSKYIEFIEK
tara:strand:+ start:477 stop:1418 length:942 start_codon:yes stop_codon:yes gene_type:complete